MALFDAKTTCQRPAMEVAQQSLTARMLCAALKTGRMEPLCRGIYVRHFRRAPARGGAPTEFLSHKCNPRGCQRQATLTLNRKRLLKAGLISTGPTGGTQALVAHKLIHRRGRPWRSH